MFTKNLNDFQKNYVAIIGVEEGLRFNNLNSDVNKTVEEVRSFVTRMESVVGLKFNASQEIGPMTGLSEVNKAKYRVEKLRSSMENIHSNFNVLSKDDEENIRTFEFLNEHIATAYKIRQEAMRGGDESKFNKLATDIRELSVFIPPAIRQESICMNKWPGLVYRAEGIISWIGDKIKALFRWIGSLFGFKGGDKEDKKESPSSKANNAEHQKKFASEHQATKEQQLKIKELVSALEKEHKDKYSPGAYDKADVLYLKDVDVGIEKDPITKEKAKAYLEKAAVMFPVVIYAKIGSKEYHELMADPSYGTTLDGGPVDTMGFIKEPSGSSVKDSKKDDVEDAKNRNEASGPSSMRVSSVRNANLLLTKRGNKVSFEPKAFLTCVRQESLEAKIKQLVKIAEGFINSSDNDIENLGKGAEQSISQVFSVRDKVSGFEKEEAGYVYHYHMTSPNRCHRIGYSKDRVVRDKVVETISPQDATSLKFSSADMTAALQEIEKFQKEFLKTEKALANEIPSKINSLEKKASDKIANDPHKAKIFFGIVKVIGMFGEIYREISRFNNQLSGIDTSSFEQVK